MIGLGLQAAGWIPARIGATSAGCSAASLVSQMLRQAGLAEAYAAGAMAACIPCGLVYAFVAQAAATASAPRAVVLMLAFGLGTGPVMLLIGLGGRFLSHDARARLLHLGAVCVIVSGLLCGWRGVAAWPSEESSGPSCPFCAAEAAGAAQPGIGENER
jgi:hypothetical protein